MMKKTITLLTALLPLASAVAEEPTLSPEMVSPSEVISTQKNQTYTYVRCWYRTSYSKDDPATDWEWAKNEDGSYFT
ncbi:thermolabile hemolysin, partial [Vibrio parahaemolyticus]